MLPNGTMYKVKRIGPSTEPWGTPWLTLVCEEDSSFTRTNWNLSDKYDLNQPKAVPLIPITCSSLCNRTLWSIVSNAALRSNRTSNRTSCSLLLLSSSLSSVYRLLVLLPCQSRKCGACSDCLGHIQSRNNSISNRIIWMLVWLWRISLGTISVRVAC